VKASTYNESLFFSWGKHSGLARETIQASLLEEYCNSVIACQISTPSIEILYTSLCNWHTYLTWQHAAAVLVSYIEGAA